jgi:hypothetical protein
MDNKTALATLVRSPASFLRTRPITIAGGKTTGPMKFAFGSLGATKAATTTGFEKYRIDAGMIAIGVSAPELFDGYNFRMFPMDDSKGTKYDNSKIECYQVPYGHNLLITGQLSGCCIAYFIDGGQIYIAHIQPDPAGSRGDGLNLQKMIDASGRFDGHPSQKLSTWGANNYGQGGKATVIGVNSKGGWELFGQVLDSNAQMVQRVDKII